MSRNEHHVVPNEKGWKVEKGGGQRSIKNFDRKVDAEKFARELSKKQGSELIIHRKDGTIERSDSHGNDPNPPRDKK
jgi:hypothetical protein